MALPRDDGRVALADIQPNTVKNIYEETTIQSLRNYNHKDVHGNVICKHVCVSDPDCRRLIVRSRARPLQPYPTAYGKTTRYHQII